MSDEPNPRFPEGPSDDDIAERLKRVRAELEGMDLPELPEGQIPQLRAAPPTPEYEARLRALEEKIDQAKTQRAAKQRADERRLQSDSESHRGLGIGLTVAYTIIGLPLFGIGVGYLLDRSLGTQTYQGIGALVGSVLGVVGAIVVLNRHQAKSR
jgi:F0F1-type ATP synthase assembly protein I